MTDRLLDIKEAAGKLGVPVESLRREADKHGMTIKIGRAVKLAPDDLTELIELCRVKPKVPVSTGGPEKTGRQSGKSETRELRQSRPALNAAKKLKSISKPTSPGSGGEVVPLKQK